ncbi:piRNA biogenesis protein EXD1 isoform X2 [Rissa tridactyla]|uniref:piRNA biogenesis protein EXD1 isoform X2 n=1 Tax=Rissa tridactyla TaxID=75485 RepID=UPI0023BAEE07|nr:piRNA biogenesis protein EXD1 isoform X2 [Rissa tridactyla]
MAAASKAEAAGRFLSASACKFFPRPVIGRGHWWSFPSPRAVPQVLCCRSPVSAGCGMSLSSERFGAVLGSTVKVTLKCGVFQGVLQHVNPDRSLLLRRVKNLETGRSTPGVKMFFDREIINEKKEEENVEYTVINCFQKFGPAVLYLKQQCVISVAGEGVNLCRYGKLSWLEIATKSRIFLFDIFFLGPQAFKNGLQMVLEDKNILKVMHDCRWISDCLFHQYGVLLFNVFDTQVADALQFSMATGGFLPHRVCTLQECLMQHLKIPSKWDAIMKYRQQMASENPDIWFLRPFPASLLKAFALKAMYLLLLHSSLMDNLMSDLKAVVHDYLNAYRTGSGDHLGSTKPTCMELPEELRQLTNIQKLRREKAIKDYRMNEDGLLIRPAMELKERNDPQKDGNYRDDRDCFPTDKAVFQITSFYNEDVHGQENQNQGP